VLAKLSEVDNKSFLQPKIGEFESAEEFRIRVEKERRQYESSKLDEKLRLEAQKLQLQRDVHGLSKDYTECAFAFTNRLHE
jgi:hypothetical protein